MKNDLWLGFAECRVDFIFSCDIDFVILDGGNPIVFGLQIKDRDLGRWVKLEQPLDDSMAERAATSHNES